MNVVFLRPLGLRLIYSGESGIYKEKAKTNISDSSPISATGTGMMVLLVLRSGSGAKVEGVLRANIAADGSISFDDLAKSVT